MTIYGKNQAGERGKAKKVRFSPFRYWVFLTTSNFLTWVGITMYVKKLEVSHNIQ